MPAAFIAPIGKAGGGPASIPEIGGFGQGRTSGGGPARTFSGSSLHLVGQNWPQIYRS